jgi:hypothetical protein
MTEVRLSRRRTIAALWLVACAIMGCGCGDGQPCDPDQRYERGLCITIEPDAAVEDGDAGPDASSAAAADQPTISGSDHAD